MIISNVPAEQAVLGAILLNNNHFDKVSHFLKPEHFTVEEHAFLYGCATDLINRGHVFDHVTIRAFLSDDSTINNKYIAGLIESMRSVVNVAEYGQLILEASVRRELDCLANMASTSASSPEVTKSTEEQLAFFQGELIRMADNLMTATDHDSHGVDRLIARSEMAFKNGGNVDRFSSGFRELDGLLDGCGASDLIILAGRPSMGKTACATSMVINMAKAGKRSAFYSFEMSGEQIYRRMLSQISGVHLSTLVNGAFDSVDHFQQTMAHANAIKQMPITVSDTGGRTVGSIRAKCRSIAERGPLGAIFVDHLRFVRPDDPRAPRAHQMGQVSYGLKNLAKEFGCPVIGLCQLNRSLESGKSKMPGLSDLRDSGEIEENADACVFLYREEYYLDRTKPVGQGTNEEGDDYYEWVAKVDRAKGKAQAIVGKNRHGACGVAEMRFDGPTAKFSEGF